MEIYKLKDKVPDERRGHESAEERAKTSEESRDDCYGGKNDNCCSDGDRLSEIKKITEMRAGVKDPERVNIYVNSRFAFSLDVAQVVDYKLKVGKILSGEMLEELKEASEFGKAYQRALEWALLRPRSVRETREYLKKREMMKEAKKRKAEWDRDREIAEAIARGEDVTRLRKRAERMRAAKEVRYDFADLILERLVERGYVDDKKFAEFWVENRNARKGASRKRLGMELMKKGIAKDIIDEMVLGRDEREEIRKIIEKKRHKYSEPQKMIEYLCRQGFSYDLAKEMMKAEAERG